MRRGAREAGVRLGLRPPELLPRGQLRALQGDAGRPQALDDEVIDNVERSDNFALGYFAIVEEYTDSITITNNEEN